MFAQLKRVLSCVHSYSWIGHMLTNLPVYCRNSQSNYETSVIKELLQRQFYSPKGMPPYSSTVLRFALLMRGTSNPA